MVDRVSNRTAYVVAVVFLALSLLAAALAPQEAQLGGWVRLTIWHGMLKWATIVGIFGMGVLAAGFLVTKRRALFDWAHALQLTLLPVWLFAVAVGVAAARLVWNGWNLGERRMIMSVAYIVIAAVAVIVGLVFEKPRLTSWLVILTSISMAVGLWWIETAPPGQDVHPQNAVGGSQLPFQVFAVLMLITCLVWVLALCVPVHRWLARHDREAEATPEL
ncbi:MAG TPA: hypothetical protein VF902_01600 [Coriobacteriia bacterium]